MAYPWSAGDTLNAADLNDYAGLVFIKSQTVGAGVSNVSVTGIDGFDAYQIVFDRIDCTVNTLLCVDDITSLTASAWQYTTLRWDGSATPTLYAATGAANAQFGLVDTNKTAATLTVYNLNGSGRTRFHAMSQFFDGVVLSGGSYDADTTSTSLTFSPASGTFSGGNIIVYGYNAG